MVVDSPPYVLSQSSQHLLPKQKVLDFCDVSSLLKPYVYIAQEQLPTGPTGHGIPEATQFCILPPVTLQYSPHAASLPLYVDSSAEVVQHLPVT